MNIPQALQLLTASHLADDTALFEGKHGIGKSAIVQQFAKENNYHLEELFLSMMDTGDLIGIPRTANIAGMQSTVWSAPDWYSRIINRAWPTSVNLEDIVFADADFEKFAKEQLSTTVNRETFNELYCNYYDKVNDYFHILSKDSTVSCTKSRHSVLFLDELNRSTLDVRQATLQLVLNKELHSHKLPYIDGRATTIVAAINPADDYQVDEMDPALIDRFIHAELEADTASWLAWGRSSKVNSVVLDFIAEHPDRLHWMPENGDVGATPRSWAKLGAFVDNMNKTPKEVHFPIMKGKLGSELAGQFLSFYNNYAKVVKLEDVEAVIEKNKTQKIETIVKKIAKLTSKQEAIQKRQLTETFFEKYIKANDKAADAMPAIAFFHSLEIEILNSFLKAHKEEDHKDYMKIAQFDEDITGSKGLFLKITTKTK